jgi:quinol monooxygenase YgiN
MSKLSVIGTLQCLDGKADEMEAVLATMVEAAREEPGVEVYSYHRGDEQSGEGNTFWFFALMTDAESMQKHGQSEAMQAAMSALGALAAGPPEMSMATPVAAIGLEL